MTRTRRNPMSRGDEQEAVSVPGIYRRFICPFTRYCGHVFRIVTSFLRPIPDFPGLGPYAVDAAVNEHSHLYRLIDIAIADNPVPEFGDVLAYWDTLRGDRFAPSWNEFDLLSLPAHLLPYGVVVDTRPEPMPFFYRYYGSAMARNHGFELTGKTSDDIHPAQLRHHIAEQYRATIASRAPRIFSSEIYVKQGVRKQDFLLRLPLSDDARTVTNVVSFERHYGTPTF